MRSKTQALKRSHVQEQQATQAATAAVAEPQETAPSTEGPQRCRR